VLIRDQLERRTADDLLPWRVPSRSVDQATLRNERRRTYR
jgi:hypothetical protein